MTDLPSILIVDDEHVNRQILHGALFNRGYAITCVENGWQALISARENPPDVVLLDVMMPEMDGFEVCRQLRTDPGLSMVPVIMVTSLDDAESRMRGLEAGADEFISKPVNLAELRVRLHNVLSLNRFAKLQRKQAELEHLHGELTAAYDETISGWARALELRDYETKGHSDRVVNLTMRLTHYMRIPAADLVHIRRGAILHDIGKIAVPDYVLHKPDRLNPDEWDIIRQHPGWARTMLEPIEFLREALDIPYHHHERWDGNGYPDRLAGEDIPLAARIFSLADTWDALTSNRPYRAACSHEEAVRIIEQEAGQQFDPHITRIFLAMMKSAHKAELPGQ